MKAVAKEIVVFSTKISIARLRHDDRQKPRTNIYKEGAVPRTPNLQLWSIVRRTFES